MTTRLFPKSGLFQAPNGKISAMRFIVVPAASVATLGLIVSLVAFVLRIPDAVQMAGVMAGVDVAAFGLKWAQAKVENEKGG
jgi:hypothetical protein